MPCAWGHSIQPTSREDHHHFPDYFTFPSLEEGGYFDRREIWSIRFPRSYSADIGIVSLDSHPYPSCNSLHLISSRGCAIHLFGPFYGVPYPYPFTIIAFTYTPPTRKVSSPLLFYVWFIFNISTSLHMFNTLTSFVFFPLVSSLDPSWSLLGSGVYAPLAVLPCGDPRFATMRA